MPEPRICKSCNKSWDQPVHFDCVLPKPDGTKVEQRPYVDLAVQVGELVQVKQAAYGDSFGKSGEIIRILYPDGIPPEKYSDVLTIVRILDKLFRIATDKDALGEDPWRDIMGYALLALQRQEREKRIQVIERQERERLTAGTSKIEYK